MIVPLVLVAVVAVVLALLTVRERRQRAASEARERTLAQRVAQLEEESAAAALAASESRPNDAADELEKVEDLDGEGSLTDASTGLFNEQFFRVSLDTPCLGRTATPAPGRGRARAGVRRRP